MFCSWQGDIRKSCDITYLCVHACVQIWDCHQCHLTAVQCSVIVGTALIEKEKESSGSAVGKNEDKTLNIH